MNNEKLSDWAITAVIIIVLGVPVLGLLYLGVMRSADVYYKAGWMIAHRNDAAAFPPGSKLCIHEFCTRTDTTLKYVGGRRGYTSEVQYRYCPVHEPNFVKFGSQLDGFLYFCYWVVAIICSLIAPCLLLMPIAIIFVRGFKASEGTVGGIFGFVPLAIVIAAWVMFAWW